MSILYIGLDDTDILNSPGTGHLAREIAQLLANDRRPVLAVLGITRHQLLNDPRVPMTAKNSANVIHLQVDPANLDLMAMADEVIGLMQARFQPGSDPGLCLAGMPAPAVFEFGRRAKVMIVTKEEAQQLAQTYSLILRELGGSGMGIIGALASVGLAASGEDGRFIHVGKIRELRGVQPVEAILAAGVTSVQTLEGQVLLPGGLVETGDKIRPALLGGQAVLLVEPAGAGWRAIRRD
jgi:tRNA(Ile2) C34 agmatinyltransferase TiaS